MKISRAWLQTYFEKPLPDAQALADALTFHAFEIESVVGDILDVKVTPNRGHDCLSHRGIAKELSAILNLPLVPYPYGIRDIDLEPKTDAINIVIEAPDLCLRYVAGYIRGVKVGPSPEWLRARLESIGQKSINNVVDATNFVMFNIGQPLHAFDAGQLRQKDGKYAIGVRKAKRGEKMLALDDKEYAFTEKMLLIVDGASDVPIGIAGIKGGKPAGITEATKDIIIESANFDGVSVRRTAAVLKLRTDASSRFEQVISPELAAYGMRASADLIVKVAGGEIIGFSDEYPTPQKMKTVSVSVEKTNVILGTSLVADEIANALTRLDLPFEKQGSEFVVTPPFERLALFIAEDLVEEIGRIIGYDKIPAVELSPLSKKPEVNKNFYWQERIREHLLSKGFSEVFTSVFDEEGERAVLNKVGGEKPFLRQDISHSLNGALGSNIYNKDLLGLKQVRLFELGTVWRENVEICSVCLAVEKIKTEESADELAAELLQYLGLQATAVMQDSPAEMNFSKIISTLPDPTTYDQLPLPITKRYQPFSKYPFIVRDIALWVPAGTKPEEVLEVLRAQSGELLVRSALFDTFEKEGKVSYAFRLVFQSFDHTLTDNDANERMESIYSAVKEKGWEVR